jgi:hypothetical protein
MTERHRFPNYSTLAKRDTPSWNDATRMVLQRRVAEPPPRRFFNEAEWAIVEAAAARIIPQHTTDKVPIVNFIDARLAENQGDGFRRAGQPDMREMWRRGIHAIEAEAQRRFNCLFTELPGGRQDDLLEMIQKGEVLASEWHDLPPKAFFQSRLVHDIIMVYYAHPHAWDEMGFGGPASPRGYVRMGFNRHDPWDPIERPMATHHA